MKPAKSKTRSVYCCQKCGGQSPKWMGRCPDCGEWNSLVEETFSAAPAEKKQAARFAKTPPTPISDIETSAESRIKSGISEFDRVLGGGIVRGSAVLIGGDPGIGKSTLLLQAMEELARKGNKVLYVSGEESAEQTKMRGLRLGSSSESLYVLAETSLETILAEIERLKPKTIVVDSVQTVFTEELSSAPGSISQVREVAGRLIYESKRDGMATFLVGHVTKDGAIAGPRVLEHMVDTVLYFEGERGHPYRVLRTVKNRFGSTNEIGVFEMKELGLAEVTNPSSLFLAERPDDVSGTVVVPSMEGTRPLLLELQSLVSPCNFGASRRTSMGVDHNRVSLMAAIMEKKLGMKFIDMDIFVNIVGGVKIDEPAADLPLAISLASSYLDKSVPKDMIIFGEIGLAGEVRGVGQAELRLKEAVKMGFKKALLPKNNMKQLKSKEIELIPAVSIKEALDLVF
ncbi:MAG: DNA repair protein RadA [bacterium]|nr:DNA repair protein RadA [bacterium]